MSARDLSFTVRLTHWAKQYLGNPEEGFFFFLGMREHGAGGLIVMIFLCVI